MIEVEHSNHPEDGPLFVMAGRSRPKEAILHNRSMLVIWALCSVWGLGVVHVAAQTSTVQSVGAKQFEGLWAKTKEECLDDEGPNSRTMIDFRNLVSGKPAPIFDQYENHCLIERKGVVGNDATLTVTCFEFWENFTKRIEGAKAIIKLAMGQNGGLAINGEKYQYCSNQPAPLTPHRPANSQRKRM